MKEDAERPAREDALARKLVQSHLLGAGLIRRACLLSHRVLRTGQRGRQQGKGSPLPRCSREIRIFLRLRRRPLLGEKLGVEADEVGQRERNVEQDARTIEH